MVRALAPDLVFASPPATYIYRLGLGKTKRVIPCPGHFLLLIVATCTWYVVNDGTRYTFPLPSLFLGHSPFFVLFFFLLLYHPFPRPTNLKSTGQKQWLSVHQLISHFNHAIIHQCITSTDFVTQQHVPRRLRNGGEEVGFPRFSSEYFKGRAIYGLASLVGLR